MVNSYVLYKKYIKAEYNYLRKLKEENMKKFNEETKDLVINKYDVMYKYYFIDIDNIINIKKDIKQNIKEMYHKLILKTHPDKNNINKDIFVYIQQAYENRDENTIIKLSNQLEKYGKIDISIIKKEDEINKMKIELWYKWLYDPIFKNLYVKKDEYEKVEKILEKIQEENNKLKEENNNIKKQLLNTI